MDISLKKELQAKLESITPEYGMVELTYASFMRCCGYRSLPLGAADSVEAVSALLDAASGVRLEVEVEGARNGGEWFGAGRAWTVSGQSNRWADDDRENVPPGGQAAPAATNGNGKKPIEEEDDGASQKKGTIQPWIRNFWSAYDSLNE